MNTNTSISGRSKIRDVVQVEAGLHEFMRQLLERSLNHLWAPDDHKLRLCGDAAAKALGYRDARLYNLLQLCTKAILREPRRRRGLKDLTLCPPDDKIIDLPRRSDGDTRSSVAELVAVATSLFEPDFNAIRDTSAPEVSSISIRALMTQVLNIAPETLIRPYYDSQQEAADAFARDPEGQSLAGLAALLTRVLHHYPIIVNQKIDTISFLYSSDGNYGSFDGPMAANLSAMLTAAALADGTRDLGFVAL